MRTYTIEFMEFAGLYFPALYEVEVEATSIRNAIEEAFDKLDIRITDSDVEFAKEALVDDGFGEMYSPKSGEFTALVYNYILDSIHGSRFRLLKGYCGKRKCFNIITKQLIY